MDKRSKIVEIKKGETGTGLLIEHDGYISPEVGDNKKLFESFNKLNESNDGEFHCPYPFIVSAVFQKYGIENANGRIYPENVLKREVEKYIETKVNQKWAYGECYRPEAMVLTDKGWVRLDEVVEGQLIFTLDTKSNTVQLQPIKGILRRKNEGKMLHLVGEYIDDIVTPMHSYPLFDNETKKFKKFVTAQELIDGSFSKFVIPASRSFYSDKEWISLKKKDLKITEVDYEGDVMCLEVENHVWYVMDNYKSHWTKNCNHPEDSVIDLSRVAMNIVELHWEGHTLVGKLEIITSPGFRKHGIISCQGDQVANLILQGLKVGVSSRGLGSVTNKFGTLVVGDDFEISCWDVVSDPSTPGAYIEDSDEKLRPYLESKENNDKPMILEKLEKFNDWLIK